MAPCNELLNKRQYLNRNQDVEDLYDTDEEKNEIENIPIKDGGDYICKGKLLLIVAWLSLSILQKCRNSWEGCKMAMKKHLFKKTL